VRVPRATVRQADDASQRAADVGREGNFGGNGPAQGISAVGGFYPGVGAGIGAIKFPSIALARVF
jgi:hypothetical protein